MKLFSSIVGVLLSLHILAVSSQKTATQGTITELTDATFDALISPESTWVVMAYADWCGHCNKFKPQLQELSKKLSSSSSNLVSVGRVNIDENPQVASRFQIAYLPTLYIIHDRVVRVLDFSNEYVKALGPRNAETMFKLVTANDKFEQLPAWSSLWNPWGYLGTLLGNLGFAVGQLHAFVRMVSDIFPWFKDNFMVVGAMLIIASFLFVLVWSASVFLDAREKKLKSKLKDQGSDGDASQSSTSKSSPTVAKKRRTVKD